MAKKFHLIFNHTLTQAQIEEAEASFGIVQIVPLPEKLQSLWSNLPPDMENLAHYLAPLLSYIDQDIGSDDIVLVQGDFGATCLVVRHLRRRGIRAVYATTRREVREVREGDRVVKRSIFRHVRFREYV